MNCQNCGHPVKPCPDKAEGCMVRCLHERPQVGTRLRPCTGWRHENDWHICDPSTSHKVMAEPAQSEVAA